MLTRLFVAQLDQAARLILRDSPMDHIAGVDSAASLADRDLIADALARLDPMRRAIVVRLPVRPAGSPSRLAT